MTRLIVVRHGYSVTNAAKCYTGQKDVPLTDEGYRQAACVGEYLTATEHIDAVYASDLSRAMDTARPTAEKAGVAIVSTPQLREIAMGVWEGMSFEDVKNNYADVMAKRAADHTYPCPGGESFADLFARVFDAIDRILAENEGKTVAVFTHGGAVRCIDCIAHGGTYREAAGYSNIDNAAITIYQVENGQFTPLVHGYTAHLKENNTSAMKELL